MAQVTTETLDRDVASAAASPPREAPAAPRRTLSTHAEAEFTTGALQRASLKKTPGLYVRAWRTFRSNEVAMVALVVLICILIFALSAGLISTYVTGFTPQENHLSDKLKPPLTDGYVLGSDGNGRDVLTRLAYGGRVSLAIAMLSATSLFMLGGIIGLVSGYLGGFTDTVIMRLVDVLLSIPSLPLLILISTLYRPGPYGLAFLLAAVGWPSIARLVRGEVLSKRNAEYVDAARAVGASSTRIIYRHILPNILPLLVVYTALSIPSLILAETGLSFIGIGVQVPTPSWGNMLGDAQQFYRTNVNGVLIPGLMIYVTSLSLYLVGNGLRDALDPKLTQ
jgi:peptide/nickel transport system permease protein